MSRNYCENRRNIQSLGKVSNSSVERSKMSSGPIKCVPILKVQKDQGKIQSSNNQSVSSCKNLDEFSQITK